MFPKLKKINSKLTEGLTIRAKAIKLLEESMKENFMTLYFMRISGELYQKYRQQKKIGISWPSSKSKTFVHQRTQFIK